MTRFFAWVRRVFSVPSYAGDRAAVCGFGPEGPAKRVVFSA